MAGYSFVAPLIPLLVSLAFSQNPAQDHPQVPSPSQSITASAGRVVIPHWALRRPVSRDVYESGADTGADTVGVLNVPANNVDITLTSDASIGIRDAQNLFRCWSERCAFLCW